MLKNLKLLYPVLILSLALNMFVVGTAAYCGIKWNSMRGDGNWIDKRIERTENRILRFLDNDADKQVARAAFDNRRPKVRAAFREMREARRQLKTALNQGNDSAAMNKAIRRSQAAARVVNENFHGVLLDLSTGLSNEARQKISDHIRRHHDNEN